MTTHKEALKLALEALKRNMEAGLTGIKIDEAITAIKEALAQPEQPKQNTVEAVKAVLKGMDQTEIESPDGWWETSVGAEFGAKKLKYVIGLLAQPEQEPNDLTIAYMAGLNRGKELAPQRTWVGLTNDEMHQLNDALNLNGRFPIIAAIEAKLKEKNT